MKTRIDRVYINNNFNAKHYVTKLLVESDHLAVICRVSFKCEERLDYWKLNTQILNSSTLISELKEEIDRIINVKTSTKKIVNYRNF